MITAAAEGMVERLSAHNTAQLSDVMDDLGIRDRVCVGIVPLPGSRPIVGPAFTVDFRPLEAGDGHFPEYMGQVPAGAVILIANQGRTDHAAWGGIRSAGARQRGATGTVVDGCYRDVEDHRAQDYPVYGRGSIPRNYRRYTWPARVQEPVTCAGVSVSPGDWVVGDVSGVVIVPADRVEDVIEGAAKLLARERRILLGLDQGRGLEAARRLSSREGA